MENSILNPFGQWAAESVKVEGKSSRILVAAAGEFIVLGRCDLYDFFQPHFIVRSYGLTLRFSVARRKGIHHWEVFVRKKSPGTPLSIGISVCSLFLIKY
jgi:hypothetical protein